jgi:hypothetical protein
MAGRDDAGFTGGVEIIIVSYAIVLASDIILLPSDIILVLIVEDGLIENMVCSCSTVSLLSHFLGALEEVPPFCREGSSLELLATGRSVSIPNLLARWAGSCGFAKSAGLGRQGLLFMNRLIGNCFWQR